MIELQQRHLPIERRRPLVVINMEHNEAGDVEWLVNNFGKNRYLRMCEQFNESLNTDHVFKYLIADVYHQDWDFDCTWDEVKERCYNYSMFGENDKSSFPYWFAHWCAFQLCALNLKIWKFKYLFHDCEKPWMRLFMPYKKIQKWHRNHNSHHLEYGLIHGFDKIDWEALMIDWECSQMSKKQCPLNCREEMENKLSEEKWQPYEKEIRSYLEKLLNKYML